MVTNSFENRKNFMHPMRRLNKNFGWGGGEKDFLLFFLSSQCVSIKFSMGSQNAPQVLNGFPKTFPIAPQFYPILFGHNSTSMYMTYKGGPRGSWTMLLFWGSKVYLSFYA